MNNISKKQATLQFLGATQTVTGSRYLLHVNGYRILIDCGLYQGLKELRLRNWDPFPVEARTIDAVLLTHAHIDHCGYLPRLVLEGFEGSVFCTPSTRDLCHLMLPDAGHLQEEDARLANQHGFSKHSPALPLFTENDARKTLPLLKGVPHHQETELFPGIRFEFFPAGHILGSSSIRVTLDLAEGSRKILFSGDIGRYDRPILVDPESPQDIDYLLVESTYGHRLHHTTDPREELAEAIRLCVARGGKTVIPSFAVGRTQELLYLLRELQEEGKVPGIPIYIDSPMAIEATSRYISHVEEHDSEMQEVEKNGNPLVTRNVHLVRQALQSQALCKDPRPSIIISASGMAVGGRILHHLKACLPHTRNTILIVGFQAEGTRGRQLVEGEKEIKIHGQYVPVRAEIKSIQSLSAHADYQELIRWLSPVQTAPRRTFIIHGEINSSRGLQGHLKEKLGWESEIPNYLDIAEIV